VPKPQLTQSTVNHLITLILDGSSQEAMQHWGELKRDFRTFFASQFSLTPEQKRHLDGIPREEVKNIQKALDEMHAKGGSVQLELPSGGNGGRLNITVPPGKSSGVTTDLSIGVFHCTFDANCDDWNCGWGP